jgi:signal transduction histidine kinase
VSSVQLGAKSSIVRRLPSIGFASALILLFVAGVASLVDTQRIAAAAAEVDEAYDILGRLKNISLTAERVATTARIFLLTGEEAFVAPLERLDREIADDFEFLRQTVAEDPDRLARLASIEDLVARRLALTNKYIDIRRRSDLQQTIEEIPIGGERLAAEIRSQIAEIEQVERSRLEQRQNNAAARHASALIAIAFTWLASLGVSLLAFAVLRKQIKERVQLEKEIVAASEQERSRIGHDLHDGLGQELTGISFSLGLLEKTLSREQSQHAKTVHDIKVMTQKSISDTRRIARDLSPGYWSGLGIGVALESLANEVNVYSDVKCDLQCTVDDDEQNIEATTQLYRIAQEAISNVLRHANARNIDLRYGREGDFLCLTVCDDGIGIPPLQVRIEGLGLRSMRYRARMFDGTLTVEARTQGGTEVRCSFSAPSASSSDTKVMRRIQARHAHSG